MKNLLFITLISLFNINATEFIYLTHFELPYDFSSEDMEASTIITKSNGSFVWGSEGRNIFLAVNEKTNVYKFKYFVEESEGKKYIISIKTINGKVIVDEEQTDVYFRYRNNPFSILETLSVDGFQLYQNGEMYNNSKHVRIKEGTPEIIGEKNNYSRSAFFRRIVSYNKNGEEVSRNMLNFEAALSFEETEFSGKKEKYKSRTEKTIIKSEFVLNNKKKFVYFYVFKPENKKNNILNINTNSNRSLPGEWIRLQKTTEEVEFYSLMESPNLTSTIESIYFQDHGICSIIFNEGGVTSIKSKFYTFNHNQIFLFTRSTQSTRNEKIFDYYGSSYMNYKITNKKLTISTESATNEFTIKE